MKRKDITHELYYTIGVLEGLTYDLNLPEAVSIAISDCVDRLEIIGAQLINKDVKPNDEFTETFGRVYPAPQEAGAD